MNYTQEQLETLNKALSAVYEDNMSFLEVFDKPLYERIKSLSTDINMGFKIRYDLEFTNNSFNIFDNENGKFIYTKTLEDYSSEVLETLDFSEKGTMFNLANGAYRSKEEDMRHFNDDIQTKSYYKILKDINQIKSKLSFSSSGPKEFKSINSMVFFGTLLGKHIVSVNEKFKCKSYLVLEPSLEIFRLSLFVTEYKLLVQNSHAYFSVGLSDKDMIQKMEKFILHDSFENYSYKYYSTSFHKQNVFNNFTFALQNLSPFSYDHYRQLYYSKESFKNIAKYSSLNMVIEKYKIQKLPVLILSPGPSLRKNFKWLKKNKDNFITIAFGAAIKALSEVNIKPDIVTNVDASTIILNQFPKESKDIYSNSLAFLASDTHKKVFDLFKKKNVFIFEANFKILKNGIEESPALSVGDNTLHILLSLGFEEIYMLGTDLSIDVDTGASYDKTHVMSSSVHNVHHLKKNIKRISNDVDVKNNYLKVKSNLSNKDLYANQFFSKIISSYSIIIDMHKNDKKFKIYNLSDGAFIPGTTPLKIKDMKLEKIEMKNKDLILKKFLKKISQDNFTEKENEYLKEEIKFIKSLHKKINSFKKTTHIEYMDFFDFRKEIAILISKHKSYSQLTGTIFLTYIKIIDNYINYVCNDSNIEIREEQLNDLKETWCNQFSSLIKDYLKIIKKGQLRNK